MIFINKNRLRSIIALNGDNWSDLAGRLGISKQYLHKKLKNDSFKKEEIQEIAIIYKLTNREILEVFKDRENN